MKKQIKVSVSILCADFTRLGEEIKKCEQSGVDELHIDVMDGIFVPVISMGPFIVEAIRPLTSLPIHSHLMVHYPWMHLDQFIQSGSDAIYLHAECYGELREKSQGLDRFPKEVDTIDFEKARKDILKIKEAGKKAYMVINPGTPLCLGPLTKDLDGVLIMSVNPGFAKQKFIPEVLPKIEELRKTFDKDIAIDGGIKKETAPAAVQAGANVLATASYFFGAQDPKAAVQYLKNLT